MSPSWALSLPDWCWSSMSPSWALSLPDWCSMSPSLALSLIDWLVTPGSWCSAPFHSASFHLSIDFSARDLLTFAPCWTSLLSHTLYTDCTTLAFSYTNIIYTRGNLTQQFTTKITFSRAFLQCQDIHVSQNHETKQLNCRAKSDTLQVSSG